MYSIQCSLLMRVYDKRQKEKALLYQLLIQRRVTKPESGGPPRVCSAILSASRQDGNRTMLYWNYLEV